MVYVFIWRAESILPVLCIKKRPPNYVQRAVITALPPLFTVPSRKQPHWVPANSLTVTGEPVPAYWGTDKDPCSVDCSRNVFSQITSCASHHPAAFCWLYPDLLFSSRRICQLLCHVIVNLSRVICCFLCTGNKWCFAGITATGRFLRYSMARIQHLGEIVYDKK